MQKGFSKESDQPFRKGFGKAWNRALDRKLLPCILCTVLIVAMALVTSGCDGSKEGPSSASIQEEDLFAEGVQEEAPSSEGGQKEENQADKTVLGEGSTQFDFAVIDKEGNGKQFEIHTDKTTVGEALSELGLIDGEESGYGLYVTAVDGVALDYDKDGMYWAFYINGGYAQTGVDVTEITEGDSYSFQADEA